jgi:hypothetical protein
MPSSGAIIGCLTAFDLLRLDEKVELTLGEAEKTGIAAPAVSLWADVIHNPGPFIAKRVGSPCNVWARLIPLSRGRIFQLGPPTYQGRYAAEAPVVH